MIIPCPVFNTPFSRPEYIRRNANIPHLGEGVSPLLDPSGKMSILMMTMHIDNAGEGTFAIRHIQVGGYIKIFPALITDLMDGIAVPPNDPGRPDIQIQFMVDRDAERFPDLFAQFRRIPFREILRQFMQTGIFRRQQFQFFPFVTVEPLAPHIRYFHAVFLLPYCIFYQDSISLIEYKSILIFFRQKESGEILFKGFPAVRIRNISVSSSLLYIIQSSFLLSQRRPPLPFLLSCFGAGALPLLSCRCGAGFTCFCGGAGRKKSRRGAGL